MSKREEMSQGVEGGQDELPYEKVIEELDQVVQRLEAGDLALEESLRIFERGVQLAQVAQKQLDAAEHRVEVLLQSGRSEAFAPAEEAPATFDDDDIPF